MARNKVSKKISKLVGEGKPQKQAVAIALDMKRRGKLKSPPAGVRAFTDTTDLPQPKSIAKAPPGREMFLGRKVGGYPRGVSKRNSAAVGSRVKKVTVDKGRPPDISGQGSTRGDSRPADVRGEFDQLP